MKAVRPAYTNDSPSPGVNPTSHKKFPILVKLKNPNIWYTQTSQQISSHYSEYSFSSRE